MNTQNMIIDLQVVGPVRTNCYLLSNKRTKEVIIVDPGSEANSIGAIIEKKQYKPVAILLTHGHFDHIMGVPQLQERYHVPVYANEAEQEVLKRDDYNLSTDFIGQTFTMEATNYLKDGEIITLAGFEIEAISTPGHTKGGMCFYFKGENVIITGDTLFKETVGRTDLVTSDHRQIIHSVCTKLAEVSKDAMVLPGHGEATTMGYERMNNPYMNEGIG